MERRAPSLLALAAITLPVATFAGPTTGGTCNVAEQPAATLLVPYLEVDLDDAGGLTTLVSIVNAAATTPTLAHVVLWTDWGIPSASFDLFLGPGDVAPINLRDVFATGRAPVSGPGAAVFDDCTDVLVPFLSAPERLQAIHTGQPFEGGCFAAPRQDQSLATGYLTVDVITRCSAGITLPLQAGYFGTSAVASLENRLWGDFYLVDPDEDFAQGETAVHLVADPDLVGGAFDGGTELLVWRDVPSTSSLPVACGSAPSWLPLSSDDVEAWNETGQRTDLDRDAFPLATQRVPVAALDSPFPFGWLDLDLDLGDGEPGQAWVMSILSAEGRFSVGQTGIRLNDPCP